MFQQQQRQQPPQASQGTRLPSFPSSVTVRVSSKSTATAASGSARGTRLVTPSATHGGLSVRQLLQRRLPTVVRQDAIRDALPFIGNGAYMVSSSDSSMISQAQIRIGWQQSKIKNGWFRPTNHHACSHVCRFLFLVPFR
jgi:hypothetical protein